jgi:hypothetical protein
VGREFHVGDLNMNGEEKLILWGLGERQKSMAWIHLAAAIDRAHGHNIVAA